MSLPTEVGSSTGQPSTELTIGQALALGALHGPAELLPISSSGHVALIPWLLGWDYDRLDGELRKSFEVALHAGTAAALLITLHSEVREAARGMNLRLMASCPKGRVGARRRERLSAPAARRPGSRTRASPLRQRRGHGVGWEGWPGDSSAR